MSAAATLSPLPKVKEEPNPLKTFIKTEEEPALYSKLLSKIKAENPPGICLGLFESSIEYFEPKKFDSKKKYERVILDYAGKRPKEIYDFDVISVEDGEIFGKLPFKDANKLGPLAGSQLVQWEAMVPIQEITPKLCPLWIILYCPANEYEHVAENIQMYQLPLKKPVKFHPAATYKNPFDKKPIRGFDDLLSGVCNDLPTKDHLKELWTKNKDGHKVLNGLNIRLLNHQVPGINWMIDREKNPATRGGILADDVSDTTKMGLGKTVQTIGLMVSTMAPAGEASKRSTLIIATNALLAQWEHEIKTKSNKSLNVLIWHGTQRKKITSLDNYDVVITTYSTMAIDVGTAPLFTKNWYRIVLDEAHDIKNKATKKAMACCTLRAENRWCLTGTPIQNNIDELYSIFRFLRVQPVSDFAVFKSVVSNCFKSPNNEIAAERVRVIFSAVMLRRNKSVLTDININSTAEVVIELPPKYKEDIELEFEPEDRILYDVLELKSKELIPNLVKDGRQYSNALALVTRLKQACNHPYLVLDKMDGFRSLVSPSEEEEKDSSQRCELCESPCSENPDQDALFCNKCKNALQTIIDKKSNKNSPSTKINKMIEILEETRKKNPEEKTIIFSQYTSMLDLIEIHLTKHDFSFCRYDGSMNTQAREKSLNKLRTDPECKIMLISLKCGALGLNLTATNRVILMDLWWNPAVEQQAVDRVHRVGQTLPVYVKRLIINDSFERKIVKLQEEKEKLAQGILSERKSALSMENIKFLFDLEEK